MVLWTEVYTPEVGHTSHSGLTFIKRTYEYLPLRRR